MTWQPIATLTDIESIVPVLASDGFRVYYATCSADDGWHDETVGDEDDGTIFNVIK